MTAGAAENDPLDLGTVVAPDPFTIQPGSIVLDRFCVIGRVRHTADAWRVVVTDLRRELGASPHHRLDLHFLPIRETSERAVRHALGAHQRGGRRADAVMNVEGGMFLLAAPAEGAPLAVPLRPDDALRVARILSAIVAGTHRAGVVGIRFDTRDLRIDAFGNLQFASWRHLLSLRFAQGHDHLADADVRALVEVLRSLGCALLDEVLAEPPRSAVALADRLATSEFGDAWQPPAAVLPAIAPFMGREVELLAVHQAVARARHQGPEAFFVTGPPGSGRTRLLEELALEFARGEGVLAILASFRAQSPNSGLGVLMEKVADAIHRTSVAERDAIATRIARAVGPMAGLVRTFSPRLAQLIGPAPPAPELALDETFIRHSATVADVLGAIGTPQRTFVLLLDDVHRSDASVRAVLYHLMTPGRSHHLVIVASGPETLDLGFPRAPVRLPLEPLTPHALAEMLRAAMPGPVDATDRVTSRLMELSRGSPSVAWRRVQSWVETGVLKRTPEGHWMFQELTDPPANVLTLPSRWSSVPRAARTIAMLIAVRAEAATPGWLAAVTGWDPTLIRTAVAELIERTVLVQDPGGQVGFPDEGVRARVLEDASPPELRAAHAAIALWLDGLEGQASVAQRAWHLEHASPEGPDEALAALHLDAGREHLTATNAERAAWHFDRALARTRDADRTRAALEGRGDARLLQDQAADALADYLAAIDRAPGPHDALVLANRAVYAFYLKGAIDGALTLANRALATVGSVLPAGMPAALRIVLRTIWQLVWGRPYVKGEHADQLSQLHTTLVATVAASHPHVGLSSLFSAVGAAIGRTSGEAARARAFFTVPLAAVGMVERTRRTLDRAEEQARHDPNPMHLGVVQHFRGQNELAFGNYVGGQAAFEAAVSTFRRAGDLSIGVISMALSILYSLDREPASVILQRVKEAESIAWRQRNKTVLPMLAGMRHYVKARCGEIDEELVAMAAQPAEADHELLPGVVGDSLVALALIRVSVDAAVARAQRARARLDAATGRPPFLEVALIAEARALLASTDLKAARRAVLALRKRARRFPALRVASRMCDAHLALREAQPARAREILAEVTSSLPTHREEWHALEGHRVLAELLGGTDPAAAHAHLLLAEQLESRLAAQEPRTPEMPHRDPAAPPAIRADDVALWHVIDGLGDSLQRALPPDAPLQLSVSAGVRALVDPELVELLIVNLVLAVRDCIGRTTPVHMTVLEVDLSPEEAAAMPDARAGRWARIAVTADGLIGPAARGAIHECQRLCGQLNGFLSVRSEVEGSVAFAAHLPAPEGAPQVEAASIAVVVHRDERTRRTLVEGIRRAGWTALEVPAGETVPEEAAVVLVESAVRNLVHVAEQPIVPIVRRGERVDGTHLRVPFLVGELDELLRRFR